MSLSLQRDLVSWMIQDRIVTLDQLQRFTIYHLDLLKTGTSDVRSEYLQIQLFYLEIIEESIESFREKMCTMDLKDLQSYAFEEIIMGDPLARRSDPNPAAKKAGTTEDSEENNTQEINSPGRDNAKAEKDTAREENARGEEDTKLRQSDIMEMMNTPISCTGLSNDDSPFLSNSFAQSNYTPATDSEGRTEMPDGQQYACLSQSVAESQFSWADEVEEAIQEEEEDAFMSPTNSSPETEATTPSPDGQAPRSRRSALAFASADGILPEELAMLREALNGLIYEHPSIGGSPEDKDDDDKESQGSWTTSSSTCPCSSSSCASLTDYDVDETALEWRALVQEKAWLREAVAGAVARGADADSTLDAWDEAADAWGWQREGMYLVALVSKTYADRFRQARLAYVARPWDRIDECRERAREKSKMLQAERGKSPLRECTTIEY
ncbi:hypothetical protein F4809DRAFT_660161 [Biscogniauxia mediterranea]|nr:hypothetical protein F4809DRAFT_660161 [Biscogniauxia mediterranea]